MAKLRYISLILILLLSFLVVNADLESALDLEDFQNSVATNSSVKKEVQQIGVDTISQFTNPEKKMKSNFEGYLYYVGYAGILILLLIIFLIYRRNKKRAVANFEEYQNTYK